MNFTMNHDDVFTGGIMPEGVYEAVVKEAVEKTTNDGRKHVSITLVIRNDIKQPYQNALLWYTIWTKKEDNRTYDMRNFNTIGKAFRCQNGKVYNSMNELLNDFVGKVCKVEVKHEEYNGNTNARASRLRESAFPTCNHVWKDAGIASMGQEVPVEDCPF